MSKNKKLIPELRFPEFQNEGEWDQKKLGEVAAFSKGKGISKSDVVENGVLPCIRYGELYTHYNETINDTISYTNVPAKDLVLSQANDVIIPSSGETQEDIATASCVMRGGIALGGDLNIIRSEINGVFLSYYLNNVKKKEIAQMAQGISVVHLYSSQLKHLNIVISSKAEQNKIAACLSSLDEVIAANCQKLKVLKDHKKGLMQNLFPRGSEKVPKYRFKEFKKDGEWIEKKLEKIGEPLMCKRIFKEQTINNPQNGIPFYKIGTFGREADAYISIELYEEFKNKYSFPKVGDILISASGTIGRLVIYDGSPAYFQDSNIVWLDNNQELVINSFLYHCYSMLKWQTSDGGIISRLYNSDLKNMEIKFPKAKEEQEKIAASLSSLDELIKVQASMIEQIKLSKKGLMQGLFPQIG